jgi:hypothetical protein
VDVFHRVFNGDDLGPLAAVDQVDHGRQRRALAAAGRAGHQRQAALRQGDVLDHGRQVQLLKRRNRRTDRANHEGRCAEMAINAAAEAGQSGDRMGKVQALDHPRFQPAGVALGQEGVGQALGVLTRQRRELQEAGVAPDAQHRWGAGLNVDIRGPIFDGEMQQLVHVHNSCPWQRALYSFGRRAQAAVSPLSPAGERGERGPT